jgi:four helix bundle protein
LTNSGDLHEVFVRVWLKPIERKYIRLILLQKISDADMENSETSVWIDFSFHCGYIDKTKYDDLILKNEEVGKLLHHMLQNPEKY